nr:hypothetical protein [Algoriphagus sp.]
MQELSIYAVLFLMLIGHTLLAGKMYRKVHENSTLSLRQKNDWKLKALIFPAYYWFEYKKLSQ